MPRPLTLTTLPNGLRIAVVPDAHATTATALVLVGVGSSYESKSENGLSHFLEHMCFKGTARRPSAKAITEEIESLGAVTNAFTDREYTGYFIKGNPTHLPTYVDILSDIYLHSAFPETEIRKEKRVIIEEINMYEDQPSQKAGELLFELLYPGHAAGRSVLGTKETVSSFLQKDFHAYKDRCYTAANTVIVFSGKVTAKGAAALAKQSFGALKRGTHNKKSRLVERQRKSQFALFHKATDQAHLLLAFRSFALSHKEQTVARLLATILGRGMSSRLALIVREELGAAYYVFAQQEGYTDHGIFVIGAGIDKTRLHEVTKRLVGECIRCAKEPVSDKELAKAKEYTIGTLRLALELSDDVANFYGGQLVLRQKVKTPEQLIKEIKAVTAKDILRVANIVFRANRANIALVGPFVDSDLSVSAFTGLR